MTTPPITWLSLGAAALLCGPSSMIADRTRVLTSGDRLAGHPRAPVRRRVPSLPWLIVPPVVFGTALVVRWRGPALGLAAAAVLATGGVLVTDIVRVRRAASIQVALHAAIRLLVAELEAGSQPAAALRAAAEIGTDRLPALSAAAQAAAAGRDAGAALAAQPITRSLGLAWALSTDTGAPLAAVLARVARDIEASADQRRAVSVALSGPRCSAVVLAALPLIGLALGTAMGARPLAFLTTSAAGRLVACVGALLDVAGVLWMRRILQRAQRS